MPLGYDNFNSSCTQKSHQILVPRLMSVSHKLPKTIGHHRSKWLEHYFCLLFSETRSSQSQWYPFWNSDIPTSQSALKQSYREKTNGQNNDDKAKKPTLGSHSIFGNYCIIIALYFRVMKKKVKATLTSLIPLVPTKFRWGKGRAWEWGYALTVLSICGMVMWKLGGGL